MSVFTAYLNSKRGEVSSFERKYLKFYGNSTVVFLVSTLGGVVLLRVSGNTRFFPAVHTIGKLRNFLEIN